MKKVFIIHRWEGGSHDDWRPWLKQKLEQSGFEVVVPDMPDTQIPVIEKWVNHIVEIVGTPDTETFFVGHSIGCQAIMRYLETIENKVGGAVFVAPWFNLDNLEDAETKEIALPWIETPIDFEKVRAICPVIKVFISSDEPYGYISFNKEILENKLGAEVSILENRGHFTEDDGCTEFPELLNSFLKMILEKDFPIVYEWTDEPNTVYEEHEHQGKVSFYVLQGSVTFHGGIEHTVSEGERFDVPVGVKHSAIVESLGCEYIVGQELEGDA